MPDLDTLALNAERYLVDAGYAPGTVGQYRSGWRTLAACCKDLGLEEYDEEAESLAIRELGLDGGRLSPLQRKKLRAIKCLLTIDRAGRMPDRLVTRTGTIPCEAMRSVIDEYLDSREARGISPKTIKGDRGILYRFAASLGDAGGFGELSPEDVTRFMGACSHMGAQTRATMLFTIRSFARWGAAKGVCPPSVASSMPTIPGHKGSELPSVYAPGEVAACIRGASEGECPKRDRAIMLMGAVMAMRASDVRALRLGDIDWRGGKMSFRQSKTAGLVTLPMPEEVTLALADYIRNERPEADNDHVFLQSKAPHLDFEGTCDSFWRIPTKGYANAGVDTAGKHHGMHSLRHSAATCMLAGETPYPVISSVLGHASSNTTMRYMAIDVESLRKVSLEVPDE